ncbi:Predicted ferric reductase [Modicisalibacter ilicicola DSM 19980]|uniref:Predicted ferric reductase n=1 Tax=Modicisalibacter ilicicola DSM 19980 TaxID=1121942 RepID=A0A1M5A056_9GAMM|nr:ferric reductase-like transmembrane domain-containing protein [Halomonas ilicicola]SHF23487.1 Predicted ferric reductase [Halomonas ilicicola DSM 19980]
MKRIKWVLWLFLAILSGAWLLADTLSPEPFHYFSFREVFVQYTGTLAMATMSLAMLLAARPKWLERPLNGLDKMYRLHKWLGIAGLLFAVTHWWWAQGTKWMVGWGWLDRPVRGAGAEQALPGFEQWLRSQRGLAETLGEWVFYVMAILIVLALVKRFPYHLFKKTHHWLALGYLVLVYHSTVLVKPDYWTEPVGWILAILMLGGSLSAIQVLSGRVGRRLTTQGTIASLIDYPRLGVIEGAVELRDRWAGHAPGQFAFVTSNMREGAHPYTIASSWDPAEHRLVFIVKALGDHTRRLRDRLEVGMPVRVEGPYGCFDFDDDNPRQIWVGAGIGITPFIARMKHLARAPGQQTIDLFHVTDDSDPVAFDKLAADAAAAGVTLHLIVTPRDGRLSAERIRAAVPDWSEASLWFCGPNEFGRTLYRDFLKAGMSPADFHRELFEMR